MRNPVMLLICVRLPLALPLIFSFSLSLSLPGVVLYPFRCFRAVAIQHQLQPARARAKNLVLPIRNGNPNVNPADWWNWQLRRQRITVDEWIRLWLQQTAVGSRQRERESRARAWSAVTPVRQPGSRAARSQQSAVRSQQSPAARAVPMSCQALRFPAVNPSNICLATAAQLGHLKYQSKSLKYQQKKKKKKRRTSL